MGQRISLYIQEDKIHEKLEKLSERTSRSLSATITRACEFYIKLWSNTDDPEVSKYLRHMEALAKTNERDLSDEIFRAVKRYVDEEMGL